MANARMTRNGRRFTLCATTLLTILTAASWSINAADTDLRPDYHPAAYAIKGATIVASPDRTIENGVVVVRKGVIESVGTVNEIAVPADAEVIDGGGLVVYPGFIDLYTNFGSAPASSRSQTGAGRRVPYGEFALPSTPTDNRNGLTPEFLVAESLDLPEAKAAEHRKLGFTDLLAAPAGAIATGQSALVCLSGLPRREVVVKSPVALHINVRPPFDPSPQPSTDNDPAQSRRRLQGPTVNYPMSTMGAVAHLRQAMLDAEYHHLADSYYEAQGGPRPALDPALKALYAARTKAVPVWWEANTRDEILRALDLAEEFGTTAVIVGGREAGRAVEELKAKNVPVVLRVDFPDEPKVPSEAEYRKQKPEEKVDPLRVLKHRKEKWDERVATAAELARSGVTFAFASDGLSKSETFHTKVREAIKHGLSPEAAVAALTRNAAEIAGLESRLGTIEPGKLGHLVALTGTYGDPKVKTRYVLADGLKFDLEKDNRGAGPSSDRGESPKAEEKEGRARRPGANREVPPRPEEKEPEPSAKTEKVAKPGEDEPKPMPEVKERPEQKGKPESPKAESRSPKSETPEETLKPSNRKLAEEDQEPTTPFADVASELDVDRTPSIKTGGNVLIKDARILTVSGAGTLERGSILIRNGKIQAIGNDLEAPAEVTVIDAKGLVAMPGIIDTHSHMAISGGVNEMSLSIVPEVRVRDVVDGDDPTIYRALAGGTTAARLLHGSANAIGGQDVIIKLRYGQPGRELILQDDRRPQGVKFALGENVTRRRDRFPNTRMGVEATIERAFLEGRAYAEARKAHEAAKAEGRPVPPFRTDLRLEALAGILDGSIKIHSHCYRSDEILMLLRVAERFGVRVQSLQHALEGYKVAAEIAAHGASASTFSDWWAYKIEAYDAVPFNAALLTEAGARVCIKSDSEELVRHLYLEAAKMVKYGGVPEAKALEMITLNPAKELGLEHRLGSIEVGKDGDIALFNAHPFDSFARCEMALIDGEVWFQRKEKDNQLDTRPGEDTLPSASPEAIARVLEVEESPSGIYALTGATLHPVRGPEIKNGTIVVANGRIIALGGPETEIPEDAQSIDAQGLDVWPGMIDAGSLIGLFEVGSLQETQDFADSAPFQPELKSSTALHPDSEVIPVTRANGVLTAYVQPIGGTIGGRGCVIDLAGWVPSEMVQADLVALNVNIPNYVPPNPDGGRRRFGDGDLNQRRKEQLEEIKARFRAALDYDKVVTAARDGKIQPPTPDPRLAALAPFAKGQKPVIFRAEHQVEILDALELAKELKLKAILSGGLQAWKVVDEIKAAGVPVIVSGTLRLPSDPTEPYDAVYANPARLFEAGIPFAIRSNGQGPDQATADRNLPYEAATAIAYGLPEEEGLKAVTLYPARILGIADQVGSLEVGKRANLVITAGHLLQATTPVKLLFIGGKPVAPESKHTKLYAKYRERLSAVQAGKAPLGLVRTPSKGSGPSMSAPSSTSPSAPADRR